MNATIRIAPGRLLGRRDAKIYGQFIEHFHREVYGGLYDPDSQFADESGLRTDVLAALREIRPSVMRWPGGCFASGYHWKGGVGKEREPFFDTAWRVEDPNTFGTDEFITFCRKLEAEPYICTNAGTGTAEEMSEWVEYCNLRSQGRWARLRRENGYEEPHAVRYWCIGNESYLANEIGAKTISEWGPFVRESAKMMKRIDPSIETVASCIGRDKWYPSSATDVDWNMQLLKETGPYIDWVAIHGYWDRLNRISDRISPYESCIYFSANIEERILLVKYLLGALGMLDRVKIAFDEWNLRSWHHPNRNAKDEKDYLPPRDINDLNKQYTTADAIFVACFLNQCLKHCDVIGMANFSPAVNSRGVIFTHPEGIIKRSTFHAFKLYVDLMGDAVIDWWVPEMPTLEIAHEGTEHTIPALDVAATLDTRNGAVAVALVNRDPAQPITVSIDSRDPLEAKEPLFRFLASADKESYNDVDCPEAVSIEEGEIQFGSDDTFRVEMPPHSVGVVRI